MYITVDAGGSKIRVAKFNSYGRPKIAKLANLKTINSYKQDLEHIKQTIKQMQIKNRLLSINFYVR